MLKSGSAAGEGKTYRETEQAKQELDWAPGLWGWGSGEAPGLSSLLQPCGSQWSLSGGQALQRGGGGDNDSSQQLSAAAKRTSEVKRRLEMWKTGRKGEGSSPGSPPTSSFPFLCWTWSEANSGLLWGLDNGPLCRRCKLSPGHLALMWEYSHSTFPLSAEAQFPQNAVETGVPDVGWKDNSFWNISILEAVETNTAGIDPNITRAYVKQKTGAIWPLPKQLAVFCMLRNGLCCKTESHPQIQPVRAQLFSGRGNYI